ncbi:hypothetical protein [Microscilla marina]|uniref:HEAT repeat domain-containing protein n=1 Tax=Microscilla marina ATCC 23134 TaxID=313606 RepID=A1ZHN3_MICM2|nr:hypothetical protein [Microscilla marina]EAY30040.1 hypothetical protein M23134_05373 [Microscilla marina ATCC 23134]
MNIEDELIRENSKENALAIANYIGADPHRFAQLMALFLQGESLVVQRAAWVLSKCADQYPELLTPHLKSMIENLQGEEVPVAVQRNALRVLQNVEVPEALLGTLAEVCFKYMEDPKAAIAVKVFAMTNLYNVTQKEPALANELKLLIKYQLPYASAGFKSRANKILTALNKQ